MLEEARPNQMSDTKDIFEQLSAYLDGELSAAEAERVEAAARGRRDLAEKLRGLARTRALLRALPRVRAGEGFAAGVVGEAERRGLLRAAGGEPSRAGLWLGRISAAAALLLAVGVGAVVSTTVWKDAPRSPVDAHPEGRPVLLAKLPAKAYRWDGDTPRAGRFREWGGRMAAKAMSDPLAASKRPRGKPSPLPAGPPSLGEAFARKGLPAGRLSSLAVSKDGTAVRRVDLPVTDLAAGRREVEAILSGAGIRPLRLAARRSPPVTYTGGTASAGGRAPSEEEELKNFYHVAGAGPRTWQAVVMDSPHQLARIADSVGDIRAAARGRAGCQRLCLPETALARCRPAALPPVSAAPSQPARPEAPADEANLARYHVARLQRLSAAKAAATQSTAPATAPVREVVGLLVITLHLEAPARSATQRRPEPESRRNPATGPAAR